jgi:hypothetical protein
MRHSLRSFLLLITLFCITTFSSTAQFSAKKICFDDGFGYRYEFTNLQVTGIGTLYAEGTTTAYTPGRAVMWLDFSGGIGNGTVELHVINAAPDGCSFYSDSFVYVGSAVIVRTGGSTESYSGSGSWNSYCFGGIINSGTWLASGPCKANLKKPVINGPAPANAKSNTPSVVVKPNPLQNSSVITYKTAVQGKVNITVYDYMQRPIKVLVNEVKSPGVYSVSWNGLNTSGTRANTGLYKVVSVMADKVSSATLQVL